MANHATSDETSPGLVAMKITHLAFPTGVTVVTTIVEGAPVGLSVNAFSSVSLEPPLVMGCVNSTSQTRPHLFQDAAVAINILTSDQADIASLFATSGGDEFARLAWHAGGTGAPLIDGSAAAFEGQVVSRIPSGTHTIFITQVTAAHADRAANPLHYFGGRFFDPTGLLAGEQGAEDE